MKKKADHRVRVAREKRDRMHQRLLSAVMASYSERLEYGVPLVEDVCQTADVSRATFYKHFSSVDEAIDIVGQQLMDEMFHSLELISPRRQEPLLRLTAGIQIFLMRSVTDPLWAAFVSRTEYLSRETDLLKGLVTDIRMAQADGSIRVRNVDAAASLVVGGMMEAIRHLQRTGQRSRDYVENLTAMILCGLGVEYERAPDLVRERSIYIRGLAPDCLDWWRDPWT
jgi:AcrR family transcriptional regulator